MRFHRLHLFMILSLFSAFTNQFARGSLPKFIDLVVNPCGFDNDNRRFLHQPFFTDTPPTPPISESLRPPPPSDPEQPFFPETPASPSAGQSTQPPPAPSNDAVVSNPTATRPNEQAKKVAIGVSVGIFAVGMLSALAFFVYRHITQQTGETRKLVGGDFNRFSDDSRFPQPSSFLSIGMVESLSRRSVNDDVNGANGSPYRKLNTKKRSDRYRPSPDLQPLPPLTKPPPPPYVNSPPPMSSDDEESQETAFYTPQGSSISNEEVIYTPSLRQNYLGSHSVSYPKRGSPRSRLSNLSPEMKLTIIPSIKKKPAIPPPPPPPPPPLTSVPSQQFSPQSHTVPKFPLTVQYCAKGAIFPAPADLTQIQSANHQSPSPHPPPPPPPPPRNLGCADTSDRSTPTQSMNSQLRTPTPQSTPEKSNSVDGSGKETYSTDRNEADEADGSKPRLKPLHWDKVRATSERATVWDQLKASSFQLNEDMIETLFGCHSTNAAPKETTRRLVLPPVEQQNKVLDPKKSQNIAIMLRALNVTRDEVCEALLDGNLDGLGADLLETLVKMAPTKEEEIKLRDYSGDVSKLGSAERFLKAILDVPFAFKRVEAMLYKANFGAEVKYLRASFQTLEIASEELKNSRLFLKLLEAVLMTGNRMNVGTNRGDARAFKLDTLLKLVDIKGTDGKTTLLHFVVQEIIRSEGGNSDTGKSNLKEEDFKKKGLQVVAGLSRELGNVKKAAGMDSDVLSSYVTKLATGLEKVRLVLQHDKPNVQGKFFQSMKLFLEEADEEIINVKAGESKALSLVKEVTEYFHGNAAKEEAHPLRIFMIVRDFLSTLDNVCKEVSKIQEGVVGSSRSFRIPASASVPVLNRYNTHQNRSSDDESLSP